MSSTSARSRLAIGLCATLLTAGLASAETAPPYARLLALSQARAPVLAESEAGVRQAQGLALQAAVRPNPVGELAVENFGAQGLDLTETTVSVGQAFELGGKRPARIASGRAEVEAARARTVQAQAAFAYDLAIAYADAEAAARRVTLADDTLAQAQDDLRIARALVEAGREAELRSLQAQALVLAAEADRDAAIADNSQALARLTALAGSPAAFTAVSPVLLDRADQAAAAPAPDPLDSPAYLAARAEREAVAGRVRIQRTLARPDLTVSGGVRRLGGGAVALVAAVSMPIPVFNRNGGAVQAAQAELEAAEARLTAARQGAEADVRAALAQRQAVASRIAAAGRSEQVAGEAYRLSRIGYEGGKLSLLDVTTARRGLTEARLRALEARRSGVAAQAALARIQGRAPFGE